MCSKQTLFYIWLIWSWEYSTYLPKTVKHKYLGHSLFPFLTIFDKCNYFLFYLDSLERLQRRSASLSSDDVVGLSHESSTLSQSSLLPRSSTLPYEATPQSRSTPRATCPRPSSPGSEMVTLEEFLQESNIRSPPTVSLHKSLTVQ